MIGSCDLHQFVLLFLLTHLLWPDQMFAVVFSMQGQCAFVLQLVV